MDATTQSSFEQMVELIQGFWVARAVHAAAHLALPDHLSDGPKTAAELADLTGTQPAALYRLLRALAGVGLFREDEHGRFTSTGLGDTLRTDVPGSLSSFVQMELGDAHHRAWGQLLHSLRTGGPAFEQAVGTTIWKFFEETPEMAAHLGRAMSGLTEMTADAVLAAYDFSPFRRLVDVGGSAGTFLGAILAAHPGATGVVFDLPHVVEAGRTKVAAAGLAERCELVGGSFFEQVPGGADLYLMKWVLRDWEDASCVEILRTCRKAMRPDARLVIVDTVIPAGNEPSPGKFIDLDMLVLGGGQERTAEEFRTLLAAAGLTLSRILPMRSSSSAIEALPTPGH